MVLRAIRPRIPSFFDVARPEGVPHGFPWIPIGSHGFTECFWGILRAHTPHGAPPDYRKKAPERRRAEKYKKSKIELLRPRGPQHFGRNSDFVDLFDFLNCLKKLKNVINSVFVVITPFFLELWLSRYDHANQHKILRILMPSNIEIVKIVFFFLGVKSCL